MLAKPRVWLQEWTAKIKGKEKSLVMNGKNETQLAGRLSWKDRLSLGAQGPD